jgi:ubiquinone/menaquinone biosynthesis C-methylase UbiE
MERQGPGSPEATRKALCFVEGLSNDSRIADIGCGTGGQTMVLARHAPGLITGVDLFQRFIDLFNENAAVHGLQDRVKGVVGSMDALQLEEESLDLIWSEGAIYNIGFERGLNELQRFLKPGGTIAVSEISWLTEERPDEIDAFWQAAYPEIDTVLNKEAVMRRAGYEVVASFVLPETCWIDNYYAP